jgi:hypothetical protein
MEYKVTSDSVKPSHDDFALNLQVQRRLNEMSALKWSLISSNTVVVDDKVTAYLYWQK